MKLDSSKKYCQKGQEKNIRYGLDREKSTVNTVISLSPTFKIIFKKKLYGEPLKTE